MIEVDVCSFCLSINNRMLLILNLFGCKCVDMKYIYYEALYSKNVRTVQPYKINTKRSIQNL